MFKIDGKNYKENIEYCFREENNKNLIEFYVETEDEKNAINFTTFLSLDELNDSEIDEEVFFNEYLVIDDIVLKLENEFINLTIDDIDVRITKILKNKFSVDITILEYKISINTIVMFEREEN